MWIKSLPLGFILAASSMVTVASSGLRYGVLNPTSLEDKPSGLTFLDVTISISMDVNNTQSAAPVLHSYMDVLRFWYPHLYLASRQISSIPRGFDNGIWKRKPSAVRWAYFHSIWQGYPPTPWALSKLKCSEQGFLFAPSCIKSHFFRIFHSDNSLQLSHKRI